MKTVMNVNTVMSKAKLAAMVSMVIFTMGSVQSFGNTKDENPVEFKYIGSTNNQPVFLLNLNNSDSDEFEITLKTSTGEVLYTEKVSGKEVQRKYRLNTDEIDASRITVEVSSKKNNSKVIYAVNRNTRVVEDVVISKL